MARELVIYTDESDKEGRHYGNFYGALIIESHHLLETVSKLELARQAAGLTGEIKWTSVTPSVADRYVQFVHSLFSFVKSGVIKLRIMFTQSRHIPTSLTSEHREHAFHILYYQFIRHGLGLRYAGLDDQETAIRLNMDQLPDSGDRNRRFKGFLLGLNNTNEFRDAKVKIRADQIAEIRSHEHILLQALDLVLGSIVFRLNDKHRDKPPGATRRGKRTIAKEQVFRSILAEIQAIRPNFNVGITTGIDNEITSRWSQSYRHWLFIPRLHKIDQTQGKRKKKPRSCYGLTVPLVRRRASQPTGQEDFICVFPNIQYFLSI